MNSAIGIALVTSLSLTAPSLAAAQNDHVRPATSPAVEISPYAAVGSAGSSAFGAAVRWPLGANFSVELEAGQRRAEINALSSNVSLLFDLPTIGLVTPYAAGGIGLDQYAYAVGSPQSGVVTHKKTAFTLNAGGGVRVPINETWGVRSDARWFNGIGRHAPERWRVYNGVTVGRGQR